MTTPNKGNKYMSKPKISRNKTYANDENDITKKDNKIANQKEERTQIRNHNLLIASGNKTDNVITDKITEKKALSVKSANNIEVQHFYDLPDSDEEK